MSDWRIDFSARAKSFLEKNHISEDSVIALIKKAVLRLIGKDVNIDLKKLAGKWGNFYRIRSGRMRVTASYNFHIQTAYVDTIEWRTSTSYKK